MPRHNFKPLAGEIVEIRVRSSALEDNLLGDPAERTVAVYLPPRADGDRFPLLVDLAAFTSSGLRRVAWSSFAETVPQRVERLVAEGLMDPVVIAFPDCFTSLGGNQFVNSVAMGRWEDFLIHDLVPVLERDFPILAGPRHRGLYGKSSGGYGALMHGMRHGAKAWGAIASHSGDCGFELMLRGDFAKTLDSLAACDGSIQTFIETLQRDRKLKGHHFHALMILALGATYDPDPDAFMGIQLPVDPHTCAFMPQRWQRWLDHDPLHAIDQSEAQDNLRSLRRVFIDCGSRDQYLIHYGTRALVAKLEQYGVEHTYEEFPDTHSGIDYRLDRSLPLLARALADD